MVKKLNQHQIARVKARMKGIKLPMYCDKHFAGHWEGQM